MTMYSAEQIARINAFQADLADGLRAILIATGCKPLPTGAPPSTVCFAFGNYCERRIQPGPRQVHRSDALNSRTELSDEEVAATGSIERKLRDGVDVYPHQSTSLLSPLSKDGLFTDWDIQHLHLGLSTGDRTAPPFVNRSRNVLLVRVTDTDAYLIDCLPHSETDPAPWWKTHLVETLHRNWASSLAALKLDGYGPQVPGEEGHKQLRPMKKGAANFTTAVSVSDGTSYMLSGGMVTAGYGLRVVPFANHLQNTVSQLAASRADNEMLVVAGDYRNIELSVARRPGALG